MDGVGQFLVDAKADLGALRAHLTMLFEGWDWRAQGGCIALRGIGEAGTHQEGKFKENKFIDPKHPFAWSQIEGHLNRWGDNKIASFVLPAIVSDKAAETGHATEDMVLAFNSIVLDIDSGNVAEKMEHCRDWLGDPTMLVRSGGVTDMGHDKVHAYWRLTAPTTRIADVARIRKLLAAKVGGDQSFGRAAQVVRIAGSIYGKHGVSKGVKIAEANGRTLDLDEVIEAVESMDWMEGCMPSMPGLASVTSQGGMMDFSAVAGFDANRIATALVSDVHAGGVDGSTRWDTFNSVAGHHIHCIRTGAETVEEARERTWGWLLEHMKPAWDRSRFDAEWVGLLNKDVTAKGVLPVNNVQHIQTAQKVFINTAEDLLEWATYKRTTFNPAPRKTLVDGLVMAGKRHLFAAEGGAGKTFLLMDLAIKLALASPDRPQAWLGQPVCADAHDGYVVLITGEDDMEELDHRWHAMDPGGELRRLAGDRLITLPMEDMGGTFPFAEVDSLTKREKPSREWNAICGALRAMVEQGKRITAVIVDTLNTTLHGEENSAEVIGQYFRIVSPVTSELKAALVISHHIKKMKEDQVIKTLDDMKGAVRGSSALINGVRMAIGFWQAHDYKERLTSIGAVPKRNTLYCAGVVKSNTVAFEGVKYLMRQDTGLLEDVTQRVVQVERDTGMGRKAWLAFSIGQYADQEFYLSATSREAGIYKQREKLHPSLRNITKREVDQLVGEMLAAKMLIKRTVEGRGTEPHWLDLAANKNVKRCAGEAGVTPVEPVWEDYYFDHVAGRIVPFAKR